VCPDGTFYNGIDLKCFECDDKCLTCNTKSTNCTTCETSKFFLDNGCYENCPVGYY
jgi:hypothetical protein